MKLILKRGNRFSVRKLNKRRHNGGIAEQVRARREQALAVVVTVPPGTAGKVKVDNEDIELV